MQLRLQKYLSEQGICSRRQAEKLIVEGKIFVNGESQTVLGTKIDPEVDKVSVNNIVIKQRKNLIYIAINKPVGIVTSCHQPDSHTVVELINLRERIYPVGRLDKDSSGLLLLTNDGILAYRLSHPKFKHEKEYVVSLEKRIMEGALNKLRDGMTIDGVKTQPAKVVKVGEHRFRIVLTEGRNRQIRKMCSKIENEVVKLKRTRIENIHLGSLKPGEWRVLTAAEKKELLKRAGIDNKKKKRISN